MSETVLVTGAARGIGLEIAKAFLGRGFTVFALSATLREELAALGRENPGRLFAYECDVRQEDRLAAVARDVASQAGALDVLVNNAAVYLDDKRWDLADADFEAMKTMYDVNAISPLRVTRRFIDLLLAGSRKLLVNVSSEAGSIADMTRSNEYGYCMSKAALNMASAILQNRFRGQGVKVLVLHPGWVRTDMGGAEAPIPPAASAARLCALMLKKWRPGDPLFFDLEGRRMKW
jgi:NAD(P)-dependent dehydrogenase (short-subunit alcohol dehydrogenase family)